MSNINQIHTDENINQNDDNINQSKKDTDNSKQESNEYKIINSLINQCDELNETSAKSVIDCISRSIIAALLSLDKIVLTNIGSLNISEDVKLEDLDSEDDNFEPKLIFQNLRGVRIK